jgi:hypothetical protein
MTCAASAAFDRAEWKRGSGAPENKSPTLRGGSRRITATAESTIVHLLFLCKSLFWRKNSAPIGQRRKRPDDRLPGISSCALKAGSPDLAGGCRRLGEMVAHRDAIGRPIGAMDAFIAATAETAASIVECNTTLTPPKSGSVGSVEPSRRVRRKSSALGVDGLRG